MELHVSSLNFRKVKGTVCKFREWHARSGNCMQAHVTARKLIHLYASSWIYIEHGTFWNILENSACILSVTFCNILNEFFNILEH